MDFTSLNRLMTDAQSLDPISPFGWLSDDRVVLRTAQPSNAAAAMILDHLTSAYCNTQALTQ